MVVCECSKIIEVRIEVRINLQSNQSPIIQSISNLQSDPKFKKHISDIIGSANKTLGSIKYTLHGAPENAKLLAYTSLCRPKLEYADVLWDPSDNGSIEELELIQSKAARFIKDIKGRHGVTQGRNSLGLQTLQRRRKTTGSHY